jgi:2-oxo-4-hydroxy-4-carboxy-5-ureidoimidazoline decarboxylase
MLNLAEVNALSRDEFVRVIGAVFEHSAWIAERAWENRPFGSRDELHRALCDVVRRASAKDKSALIRAHPDLVGNAVLTTESQNEQQSAGLGSLNEEERQRFRDYNAQYRERFGFPFVICARLSKKDVILRAFPVRLQNSPDAEVKTALDEIYKIADLRLRDLLK